MKMLSAITTAGFWAGLRPVGAGLHSDEEWVDIASLMQLYEVLRRFVTGADA